MPRHHAGVCAMSIANKEEVKSVLADFEGRIRAVVDHAWAEYQADPNRGKYIYSRTGSNILFDFIARHALAEFDNDAGIHVVVKPQTVQFLFKDRVLVRFKKGNARGVGSNIETQTVLDFIDPQLCIPDLLPDVHRVEASYRADELGLQLKEVAIVARNRSSRVWAYALNGESSSGTGKVVTLPQRLADSAPPRVTPKKSKKPKQDDSSGK
jgi:hypothetical protein